MNERILYCLKCPTQILRPEDEIMGYCYHCWGIFQKPTWQLYTNMFGPLPKRDKSVWEVKNPAKRVTIRCTKCKSDIHLNLREGEEIDKKTFVCYFCHSLETFRDEYDK